MTSHLVCKIPIPLCLALLFWTALPTFATSYREVNVPGSTYTSILGINSAGEVVGQYIANGRGSGFLYSNGSFTDTESTHSFVYRDGQFSVIAYPGATSTQANEINSAGDIAGGYVDQASKWHGFLLHEGVFTSIDIPGANGTEAFGVNNQGVVSGNFATDCDFNCDLIESFLFYRGHLRVVGALNTEVRGINNQNQVVGECNVVEGGNVTGCLLARHETRDWNYPGMYSTQPYGINDAGVVVGEIVDYSNLTHGFVANP